MDSFSTRGKATQSRPESRLDFLNLPNFDSSPINRLPNLLMNQRKNISDSGNYGKLRFLDMKRIDKCLLGDIFSDKCVCWSGEIKDTHETDGSEGYASVSFRGKKVSVRRLIFHNFVDEIDKNNRIETSCNNKICCNINHLLNTFPIGKRSCNQQADY